MALSSSSAAAAAAAVTPPSAIGAVADGGNRELAPSLRVAATSPLAVDAVEVVAGRAAIAASPGTNGDDGGPKAGSTYADRFVRLIHLMDPRHTLITEGDVRRYQRLLKDAAGQVNRDRCVPDRWERERAGEGERDRER